MLRYLNIKVWYLDNAQLIYIMTLFNHSQIKILCITGVLYLRHHMQCYRSGWNQVKGCPDKSLQIVYSRIPNLILKSQHTWALFI